MIQLLRALLTKRRNRICPLERLPDKITLQIAAHLAPELCDLNALLRTDRLLHQLLTRRRCAQHPIAMALQERNAWKLKFGHPEIKEKATAELQNENDTLKTRIKEWRHLSNKVVRLRERIAGMLNTEKGELKVALVKKEAKIGELEPEVGRIGRALEARIPGPSQRKSQQEQDTRERAGELERLKETIKELQADATKRTRAEAAGLQADRTPVIA
ncbi:hypothetical protein Q9L58_010128 [Maublancomyces gigas]|uniref:Uncharacterized protein n=1 Tax=Discina gigas TaxID=1032678 RepID=A0ABR3G503_9PEZI